MLEAGSVAESRPTSWTGSSSWRAITSVHGEISGASVCDTPPTVLALLGSPPADNMRGSVLWPGLDESIPHDRYQHRIATYETGERRKSQTPVASPADLELKDRLRSLGYLND